MMLSMPEDALTPAHISTTPPEEERLRSLASEWLLAAEREQRRLAGMLHDDLQQLLLAARFSVQVFLGTKDFVRKDEIAHEMVELLDRSLTATRTLAGELGAPTLAEQGLAAALHWLASMLSKQHEREIVVDASAEDDPASADLRLFLFQGVRELLRNAVRFAENGVIHVTMNREANGTLKILVADEGPGFDPNMYRKGQSGSSGSGLVSLRRWAILFGGELCIDSAPGCGTRITLLTPPRLQEKLPGNRRKRRPLTK